MRALNVVTVTEGANHAAVIRLCGWSMSNDENNSRFLLRHGAVDGAILASISMPTKWSCCHQVWPRSLSTPDGVYVHVVAGGIQNGTLYTG